MVARYNFQGRLPPNFLHKLRRHKQNLENISITLLQISLKPHEHRD